MCSRYPPPKNRCWVNKEGLLFVCLNAVVQLYHVAPDEPDQVGEVRDGCLVSNIVQHRLVVHWRQTGCYHHWYISPQTLQKWIPSSNSLLATGAKINSISIAVFGRSQYPLREINLIIKMLKAAGICRSWELPHLLSRELGNSTRRENQSADLHDTVLRDTGCVSEEKTRGDKKDNMVNRVRSSKEVSG